jgi:subtilisin family serine protease
MKTVFFLTQLLATAVTSKKFIVQVKETPRSILVQNSANTRSTFSVGNLESKNIKDTISFGDFSAYVMEYEKSPVQLFAYPEVTNIEEDHTISLDNPIVSQDIFTTKNQELAKTYLVQTGPVWNLDRIDQRENVLNQKYFYSASAGANSDVYVIDTGIDISHPEFENRIKWGGNFVDNKNIDCNGHGTHVSGTIGSKTYGVSKKTNLIAVKVLGCDGSGSYSGVLKGMEFVFNERARTKRPSIINMSLGGPKSDAIDKAIDNLDSAGIFIIVAAGNSNEDACNVSPGGNKKVTTVAATTQENSKAYFSNFGSCVNILAPGTNIISTFPSNKTQVMQGTSQATPSVAGFYSLVLSENPALNPDSLRRLVNSTCTKNTITGFSKDTLNCFLYTLV